MGKGLFYQVLALICLVVALIGLYKGEDITILWISFWGIFILGEVSK